MILLHRVTPFALFAVAAAGFGAAMQWSAQPLVPLAASALVAFLLFARLSGGQLRTTAPWNLMLAPLFFLVSAQGLFLLLETSSGRLALAALASLVLYFYAEQIFAYVHAPALYQPFAIQHLSLGMNVLTVFCAGAFAFGARVFLQAPFLVLAPGVAVVAGYCVFQTLWASKMETGRAVGYGVAGGIAAAEALFALAFLPTGFYVNAAVLALAVYVFLGLARASFLNQLSRSLAIRYVVAGSALTAVLLGTAAWH